MMNHITHLNLDTDGHHATVRVPVMNFSPTETLIIRKGQELVTLTELDDETEIDIDVDALVRALIETPDTASADTPQKNIAACIT